ncbi:MAG: hypothetical protein MK010_01830 [Erythrobacter sp.]|nr:hypothetical protein [Erythrobacter sp.]
MQEDDQSVVIVDPNPTPQDEARDFSTDAELGKLRVHDRRSDLVLKRRYFQLTQKVTGRWACFIIIAVSAQIVLNAFGLGLSDAAFIALITTTTTTLLGFWFLIGRYLFPQGKG